MESLVKLTVKTPNQGFDDIQVNCQMDWTVQKLKEYLQDVYPSKPSSSSQKLIYLGRLLQDHLSLKEVFGDWGARTLHIVCNESSENTTSIAAMTSGNGDGLRYRGSTTATTHTTSIHNNLSTTSSSTPNPIPAPSQQPQQPPQQQQQLPQQQQPQLQQGTQYYQMQAQLAQQYQLQMQQYYQHMIQWQQQYNTLHNPWTSHQYAPAMFPTPPNTPASPVPNPFLQPQQPSQPPQQPQPQQPQQQQVPQAQPQQQVPLVQPQQQPQRQAQQPPAQLAGGGGGMAGMADEEDDIDEGGNGRQRDWLDWLYTSLRAVMLFSIVYFYSSTSRFLMVTILAFILYLYQNGWFTPRRVGPPQPQAQEPQQQQQQEPQEQEGEPGVGGGEQQNEQPNEQQQTGNEPRHEPPRPNPLRTLCTFCVSFVTSLVPNPPAVGQQ